MEVVDTQSACLDMNLLGVSVAMIFDLTFALIGVLVGHLHPDVCHRRHATVDAVGRCWEGVVDLG